MSALGCAEMYVGDILSDGETCSMAAEFKSVRVIYALTEPELKLRVSLRATSGTVSQ